MNAERHTVVVAGRDVVISPHSDKPLMFLLRMASRGMGVWDPVWDGLAQRFSVAQFDLGMPDEAALAQPGEVFRAFAASCAEAATALGHESFHVFGWNGGTHVASLHELTGAKVAFTSTAVEGGLELVMTTTAERA